MNTVPWHGWILFLSPKWRVPTDSAIWRGWGWKGTVCLSGKTCLRISYEEKFRMQNMGPPMVIISSHKIFSDTHTTTSVLPGLTFQYCSQSRTTYCTTLTKPILRKLCCMMWFNNIATANHLLPSLYISWWQVVARKEVQSSVSLVLGGNHLLMTPGG